MKIIIWTYLNEESGLGHFIRSMEFGRQAEELGHNVCYTGNRQVFGKQYYQIRPDEPHDLWHLLHQSQPDWLVMDVHNAIPEYALEMKAEFGNKIINLNCQDEIDERIDLSIVQGFSSTKHEKLFSGPEMVIIRESITAQESSRESWLIFGGNTDSLEIGRRFHKAMPKESANIIFTETSAPKNKNLRQDDKHKIFVVEGNGILEFIHQTKFACLSMGMIAWEVAAIGAPMILFSASDSHFKFAKRMEDAGLAIAYPHIGKPKIYEMKNFIKGNIDFIPTGERPDSKAPQRILELMEKNNA